MKGLTLTQPYATLVAIGAKHIETRSWSTAYRGLVAIHAGQGLGPVGGLLGLQALCADEPFTTVLEKCVVHPQSPHARDWRPTDLPYGAIVAVARLVDCRKTQLLEGVTVFEGGHEWRLTDQERAFGDCTLGRFAWLLADVQRLAEPVPCRGALGLWTVPEAAEAAVRGQL
ncbi:MAG: ASCH domain-containing protein [Chloroflexales bacterium]